jgi:hypothetical protein
MKQAAEIGFQEMSATRDEIINWTHRRVEAIGVEAMTIHVELPVTTNRVSETLA